MDKEALKARFPTFKVKSDPDPDCVCSRRGTPGVSKSGNIPCLCVCLGGDNRAETAKEAGRAAAKALSKMMNTECDN